jgi:hypothetical protein
VTIAQMDVVLRKLHTSEHVLSLFRSQWHPTDNLAELEARRTFVRDARAHVAVIAEQLDWLRSIVGDPQS